MFTGRHGSLYCSDLQRNPRYLFVVFQQLIHDALLDGCPLFRRRLIIGKHLAGDLVKDKAVAQVTLWQAALSFGQLPTVVDEGHDLQRVVGRTYLRSRFNARKRLPGHGQEFSGALDAPADWPLEAVVPVPAKHLLSAFACLCSEIPEAALQTCEEARVLAGERRVDRCLSDELSGARRTAQALFSLSGSDNLLSCWQVLQDCAWICVELRSDLCSSRCSVWCHAFAQIEKATCAGRLTSVSIFYDP